MLVGSNELQDITLSALLKNSYLLSMTKKVIDESFFEKVSYRLIYKALSTYYNKYASVPTERSLMLTIEELHREEYGELGVIKDEASKLFNAPEDDEKYVLDKVSAFIRRNKVEGIIKSLMPKIRDEKNVGLEDIAEDLIGAVRVNLTRSTPFVLSDLQQLPEIRKAAMGGANSTVIKSFIPELNQKLMYGGYNPGSVNLIVAPPGSGKTSFMINEGAYAARQGFDVLHLFLGDMVEYDGFIRYLSCISGILQKEIFAMGLEQQQLLIKKLNLNGDLSRITTVSYAASELTVDQMIEAVRGIQDNLKKRFKLILVDYADNLVRETDSMYDSGGIIFNRLSYLSRVNNSVIIVGSQPKIQYWGEEIIPLEGAAESSKKQHVIDLMMCLGKPCRDAKIGSLFVPKVRRGEDGYIIRMSLDMTRCRMKSISDEEYLAEREKLKLPKI